MDLIISAGGVVIGRDGRIVVVRQGHGKWSLPKGHVDPGENELAAAKREIEEESGIPRERLELRSRLGEFERVRRSENAKEHLKRIVVFTFRTDVEGLAPQDPHNPEARWVLPEDAAEMMGFPEDAAFIRAHLPGIRAEIAEMRKGIDPRAE